MQQYLPFTALKLDGEYTRGDVINFVATVLTVYGIETKDYAEIHIKVTVELQQYLPFTALKQFYRRQHHRK